MSGGITGGAGTLRPDFFHLALDACPVGILAADADGIIAMVNPELERLFGYDRNDLIGRPVELLVAGFPRGGHASERGGQRLHSGRRQPGARHEFIGLRKDGSEFWIEAGVNEFYVAGGVLILCAIVDVSDRKRIEQAQDDFVTTVSHELRTPMTSIAGSLGLLIGGAAGSLSPSAAHFIEIAYTNCRRLVRLVNDILDIKKLESGQMEFDFQRCDARALVEQAVEANRGFADGYNARIRLDAEEGAFDVSVDPDRFVQAVTNLLSNALKFSPPGEEVVVSIEIRGDSVRIGVRDRGAGIPAAFRPRVFEKFAQGNGTNGLQKTGTGLGLSIVRQLVVQMNGQIGFDDAPGGGTLFHIDLPVAKAEGVRAEAG
jgi:PAS domain S-box-containing protein